MEKNKMWCRRVFIFLCFLLCRPGIGLTQTSAYERSNAIISGQLQIIQDELADYHSCKISVIESDFLTAENKLFSELRFLNLNEKKHFLPHPDFSGVFTYCYLIRDFEIDIKELNELAISINEKKQKMEVARQIQDKMVKELNTDFQKKVIKGALEVLKSLNPASGMNDFVRKVMVSCARSSGRQETLKTPKWKFVRQNSDLINRNVKKYIKNELREEYKKNYPDSIGGTIEKKLKNGEKLNYNENSFLRLVNKRTQLEIENLARQEYEKLRAEIPELEKKRDAMRDDLLDRKKCIELFQAFCTRLQNFKLWTERIPAPKIGLRLTSSHSQVQKGQAVTFTYAVVNLGNLDLSEVHITSDTSTSINLMAKDRDRDAFLDPGETWIFESQENLQSSTVNLAQVKGKDNVTQKTVIATASAKVAVISLNAPLVAVPDLFGSPKEAADEYLKRVKLILDLPVRFEESTQHTGLVCRQSPEPNKMVPEGSPVRIWVATEQKPDPVRLFIDPPTRSIESGSRLELRALLWYDDGTELDVTDKAVWQGAPGGVFLGEKSGTFYISASYKSMNGSATINVQRSPWSVYEGDPPISSADDLTAKALPVPADAYTWFVLCNKETGEVTYGEHPDHTRHFIMGGPFPGPRTTRQWIEQNCPNGRCTLEGVCAKEPAKGGEWKVICGKRDLRVTLGKYYDPTRSILIEEGFLGEPDARAWADMNYPEWECTRTGARPDGPRRDGAWGVYCNKNQGIIVATKEPQAFHYQLAASFHSLLDAQRWMEQNYPSGLCDNMGRYVSGWGNTNQLRVEDVEENISDNSGWGTWDPAEDEGKGYSDFVAPGSLAAKNAVEATEKIRPQGEKFAKEWNDLMRGYEEDQAKRQAQANQFLVEGITATAQAVGDILASNIKRKNGQKTQSSEPSYNIGPVGPNYNPVDGWGKPGQVPSGPVTCPGNRSERETKCRQTSEYIRKINGLKENSEIWNKNVQRANSYISQCCGNNWTNEDVMNDADSGEIIGGSGSGEEGTGNGGLGIGINLMGNEVVDGGDEDDPSMSIRYPGEDGYWWIETFNPETGEKTRKRTNKKVN